MAVAWDVLEGKPVSPQQVVARTLDYLRSMTGDEGWRLHANGQVDGSAWTSVTTQPGSDAPAVEWDVDLTAHREGPPGRVQISSTQETDDDGTLVEGHAAIEVLAHRTQTSSILGLAAGLAVYALSGGELSGTGLDRWHKPDEVDEVLRRFAARPARNADTVTAATERLVALLGVSALDP